MKNSFRLDSVKENIIKYETYTYYFDNVPNVKLTVSAQNKKVMDYLFTIENPDKVVIKENHFNPHELKFRYYREDVFTECKTKHFTEIEFDKFRIPFNEFKNDKSIDLNRVLAIYTMDHTIFRLSDLTPVSTVLWYNYIGGINNQEYRINKIYEHLKKSPKVVHVEIEDIPHYNQENDKTKGLKLQVCLDRRDVLKIWKKVKNDEFPTVRFREQVLRSDSFDILGIKKFRKKEKVNEDD